MCLSVEPDEGAYLEPLPLGLHHLQIPQFLARFASLTLICFTDFMLFLSPYIGYSHDTLQALTMEQALLITVLFQAHC